MTRIVLTHHERRAIALTLLILGPPLVVFRAVPAWRRSVAKAQSSAAASRLALVRAEAAIRSEVAIRDTLARRSARLRALASRLVTGEATTSADASIAALVSQATTNAGGRLGSIQIVDDTTGSEAFMRIGAKVEALGDVTAITRLLVAIEAGHMLLHIRDMTMTQSEPGAPPTSVETLRIEFYAEGLSVRPSHIKRGK
jgi:hypothetical protein